MNEKIDRINKYNNEIEDASKYTKKIKSESYTFIDDENINNNFGNNDIDNNRLSYNDFYVGKKINNKDKIKKTKGMSVAEFNNKRFEKKSRGGKSYNGKNINKVQVFIQWLKLMKAEKGENGLTYYCTKCDYDVCKKCMKKISDEKILIYTNKSITLVDII